MLRAASVVVGIRLALWWFPYATVIRYLTRRRARLNRQPHPGYIDPSRIAWRVSVAARAVPRSTCLVQALAGQQLLAAAGHDSTVHFGVAIGPGGPLGAHAWLECQGRIVLGGDVSRFTVFESVAEPR